ncbi:aminodeoxychorismate lyase [Pseudomonas matsuisoli]|uniref:Aminodeoxychorismate lyase n=1 Tax=Pseudomonas matsuisoli TaxID=1515666 RepID=A0A917PT27_9PSED|nr:aminodeoxychorismate lyase [Pseudomonas matsuisoli]GGJ90579.1 aminodeoxychorismate lyase [Pseudomonas matsuisoli]
MLLWIDGQCGTQVPAGDRGLAYGDGLFETIAVLDGNPSLLPFRIARLQSGCRRLSIPLDVDALVRELHRFGNELGTGVAKLIITRGDGVRGYAPPAEASSRRVLIGSPLPAYPSEYADEGIAVYACRTRLAEQPLLAGMKHLNRLEQVLARAEWTDRRYAEGLMCDTGGRAVEGVFSNLFIVEDSRLVTPSLHRCGVAGVMREALMSTGPCDVEDITIERLQAADEVFMCNSLYGIWPVTEFREHRWLVGAVTRKMQRICRQLLEESA